MERRESSRPRYLHLYPQRSVFRELNDGKDTCRYANEDEYTGNGKKINAMEKAPTSMPMETCTRVNG
jgi:hypothetical protein